MPATITLFEHDSQDFDWTDRDVTELERLRGIVGADMLRPIIYRGVRRILASQFVGVFKLGARTVQVLPKIFRQDVLSDKARAWEASLNLLHMLEYAGRFRIHERELAPLFHRDPNWFEILTRLFTLHLAEEWQRGAYRGYQLVEEELTTLKGKWRIVDQLRRPARKHVFAVAYDEFTADNQLNRIFRFVVERLWHLTRDPSNRQQLGVLREWMEEVTLRPSIAVSEANPSILTRLTQRFEPLLNLARLFLDKGALRLAVGDTTTYAFLFDMNQLFEAFVASFIRQHRDKILPPDLQSCALDWQSHSTSLFLAATDGKPVFRLRPDLVFSQGDVYRLLLDTKYKLLDESGNDAGVSQSDFYQMYAYSQRYDCPHVLLLYPQTADMTDSLYRKFLVEDGAKTVSAVTIDLRMNLRSEKQGLIDQLHSILTREFIDAPIQ